MWNCLKTICKCFSEHFEVLHINFGIIWTNYEFPKRDFISAIFSISFKQSTQLNQLGPNKIWMCRGCQDKILDTLFAQFGITALKLWIFKVCSLFCNFCNSFKEAIYFELTCVKMTETCLAHFPEHVGIWIIQIGAFFNLLWILQVIQISALFLNV